MEVCVWAGGGCATVAVPDSCTTAAELEEAVAAEPSLGLEAGKFRLVKRGLRTVVDDEGVRALVASEHLEAVVRLVDSEQSVKCNEPVPADEADEEVNLQAAKGELEALFPFGCICMFGAAMGLLFIFLYHDDWEGTHKSYMSGSTQTLCAVERTADEACAVTAEECADVRFPCGVGFVGVDINTTTCYVQPGCRGVHFAEPEPSADFLHALPLSLLPLAVALPLCLLCACSRRLLWRVGCCRHALLRATFVCGLVLVLGVIGLAGYYLHVWEDHVDSRKAWERDGRLETCNVTTHPVDALGERQDGYGYMDVTSPLCPRPMRMHLGKSEHKTTTCSKSDSGSQNCRTTSHLSLGLGRTLACYTTADCRVEPKRAVDVISDAPLAASKTVIFTGFFAIVFLAYVVREVQASASGKPGP